MHLACIIIPQKLAHVSQQVLRLFLSIVQCKFITCKATVHLQTVDWWSSTMPEGAPIYSQHACTPPRSFMRCFWKRAIAFSSAVRLSSSSPKRLSINALALRSCLYSTSNVLFRCTAHVQGCCKTSKPGLQACRQLLCKNVSKASLQSATV